MRFQYMGLSAPLLQSISSAGYDKPTPIQWQAIPAILQGKDLLGIAQTGTGKTASFVLPMLDKMARGQAKARMPRSLILEPTRELAAQVAESFEKYGKNHDLSMALLIGGVSMPDQVKILESSVDVLIATPGRLLDHFERGNLMLSGIQTLVVDEADRMLDMGFIPDVETICSKIVQVHQTLFFSATMPPPIKKLADRFLNDPKVVEVAAQSSTAKTITQSIIKLPPREKESTLKRLLEGDEVKNAIIFCNRKTEVKAVHAFLKGLKLNADRLHGDMAQSERMDVLKGFKDGNITLLVASDVAARGLDIPDVSHVYNYDVPQQAEDYVHRIGRTGRAGKKGIAVTLVTKKEEKYLDAIEKAIKTKLQLFEAATDQKDPVKNTDLPKIVKPVEKNDEKPAARDEQPAEQDKKPAEQDKKPSERNKKPASAKTDRPKSDKSKSKPEAKQNNNKSTVGFGDHVPAFLMRK